MEELLDPPKQVLIGPQALEGDLTLPPRAKAIIVFAHGSGSGRRSPRNLQVAHALNEQRLGTLLFDLLRPEEALDRGNVFDIELLGRRVTDAIEWLDRRPSLAALPLGLFGASTGAAAALVAAAARPALRRRGRGSERARAPVAALAPGRAAGHLTGSISVLAVYSSSLVGNMAAPKNPARLSRHFASSHQHHRVALPACFRRLALDERGGDGL